MGHLHGLTAAGLTSNMPTGHMTAQPGLKAGHLSTAQNLPGGQGKQR